MTQEQDAVFSALARGRLIFPFKAERSALRATAKRRSLIDDEAERLSDLDGAFQTMLVKDKWFHSAMQAGDTETARRVAEEALAVCQELA